MEEVYVNILERIKSLLPQLSYIDEDYGQLEMTEEEDHYPVTFPCALIGEPDTEWEELTGDRQRGKSLITIRLAMDCYEDSHAASGTYHSVMERQQLANDLHKALRGFKPAQGATALIRTHSRGYSLPGAIKVIEFTFAFRITYSGD